MEKVAEVIRISSSDRLIYLEFEDGVLCGLNYMQGEYDYEEFKKSYMKNDQKLFEFFMVLERNPRRDITLIQRIDDAIWIKVNMESSGYIK